MKKGWKTEPLGELCDIRNGSTPSKGNPAFWDGGTIPWFTIDDMREQGREISHTRQKITKLALSETSVKLLPEDSVLLCCTASVGEFAITRIPLTTNQQFNGLVVKNRNQLDPNFLFHYASTLKDELLGLSGKTTIDFIPISRLRDVAVPVPPLAEQQRIVGLLDEAFEGLATAKANAEKNLQNARALFESHLQSVFTQRGPGWGEKPLGDLCDFLNGFAFKSGDVVAESQTQLVRMGNLYGNQLDLDRNPVFYPDSFATEHSRYVLEEGDIIMSLTGTTGKEDYGFAVRIPDCGHTLLMNQRIMKFDAMRRDIIDDGYLLHYLRSRCFLDILYPTANGTRQANLSSVTMKLLPVPLRSLKEQKAIATKLDDLREETQRLARLYELKHAALEALKKSLLHQAFTGAL